MATAKPRFPITVAPEVFEMIEDYRHEHKITATSKAAVELIELGIAELKRRGGPIDLDDAAVSVAHRYSDLDPHGKEAVNCILDIEASRVEKEKAALAVVKGMKKADNLEVSQELVPHISRTLLLYSLPASAGSGVLLDSDDYERVEVGPEVSPSANFGVRISGDSMEPQFPDGHIAWVKRTSSLDDGQIGVFIVNGEGFIKKQARGILISLNPARDSIPLSEEDDVRTCGLVVGVSEDVY